MTPEVAKTLSLLKHVSMNTHRGIYIERKKDRSYKTKKKIHGFDAIITNEGRK
jgi:hypothetical protein